MSLATRCTACGTVFRVVHDQLKVSEGWVRCGRCGEVFNALEGLFDLARDAPPDEADAKPSALAGGSADGLAAPATATPRAPSLFDKIDAQLKGSRGSEHGVARAISARDRLEFPDAQFDPDMGDDEVALPAPIAAAPLDAEGAGTDATVSIDSETESAVPGAAPEFLQRAQRQARWQSPRMRALQGVAATALVALLGLQVLHHARDSVAARWPAALPLLTAWCGMMSCAIEAPRRIEDVAVESSSLTRATPELDAFKLSVSLRNRGATVVALPSIDLSLTDANGQLIARRMLSARDFRVASASIQPGADAALALTLTAGAARVSGYTVELFYP